MAAPALLDPNYLISTFGLAGLLLVIFAECGLLIGFFLPGDSLLFTAGLLVSQGTFGLPLWTLLVLVPVAAVAGNLVGYWIGLRAGPVIFDRPDSRLFRREYVERSHAFFQRYGPFTVLLARFVPIVRTFATVMAGASRMRYSTYAGYSLVGGVLWGAGVTTLGYYLGQIAFIRDNVEAILVAIVVLSVVPVVLELLRARRRRARAGARPGGGPTVPPGRPGPAGPGGPAQSNDRW
ncbi:MAG TPA: VTT domain-containing protein [Mycobacteriales bacterium]|nr:VTT domain-containing protein [Mycobacteriales bacterium]